MMIMGRSVADRVPIAMLCFAKEETGDKIKFVLADNFRIENGISKWDAEQVFNDFNSALRAWFNYEKAGLRSVTVAM